MVYNTILKSFKLKLRDLYDNEFEHSVKKFRKNNCW